MGVIPPVSQDDAPPTRHEIIAPGYVRRQAIWSGVAAVILLYLGHDPADFPENAAAQCLRYTMQLGGLAMAIVTLFLLTGIPRAIVVDGVVSILIGAGLTVTALLLLWINRTVDANVFIDLFFAYVFITSGWRDWQHYRSSASAPDAPGTHQP